MASAQAEERQQKQFKTILEELLKLPENKTCADCGTAAPRWASSKLGIFICMKCSGIHRSLGVHISFVRSVTLDKWKQHEVDFMQQMGNARANSIWEGGLTRDFPRPHPGDQHALERFIRQKYEQKRFYKDPSEASPTAPPAPAPVVVQAARPAPAPAPVQPRAAPAPSPATGDLLGSVTAPAPASVTAPAPVSAPPSSAAARQQAEFGAFVGSTPASSQPTAGGSLAAALAPPSAEAQKANIMNLFNTGSVPAPVPGFGAPAGAAGYPGYPPGTYPYAMPPGAAPPPGYAYAYPPGYAPPGYAYPPPHGYPPGAY